LPQRRKDAKEERKEDKEEWERRAASLHSLPCPSLLSSFASLRLCGRFFFGVSKVDKRTILIQLDSDLHPSVFDRVVAIDAGVDELFSYGGVRPEQVAGLVH